MDYFTRSFFTIISSPAFGFIVATPILKEPLLTCALLVVNRKRPNTKEFSELSSALSFQ